MNAVIPDEVRNFVLLGEAGCGKSELAINLSRELVGSGLPVHLFDLDMTKPLLRTREQAGPIERLGIELHFEEQYADAPTTTGGVQRLLRDDGCYTVLDVGGDHIGARAVGGYAPQLNRDNTRIWYLVNPFRPWSLTPERAAQVYSEILGVSHLHAQRVHFVGNPYFGADTSAEDVLAGYESLLELVDAVDFLCVPEHLAAAVADELPVPVFPIRRYLADPWK